MNKKLLAQKLHQLTPTQYQRLKNKVEQQPLISGNDLIAQVLNRIGITHIYGIPGVPVEAVMGSCTAIGIRCIGTRHQQGATLAAAAQNYSAGKLVAAVIVSSGPAITNTLTGILVARDNAWPLIVLGGSPGGGAPGQFHELDAASVLTPVTKTTLHIVSPDNIVQILLEAAQIAMNGRPGPVFIEIDQSVFSKLTAKSVNFELKSTQPPALDKTEITQATLLLQQAKRPLLVIGKGIRWSKPYEELKKLTALGIPFITSPMGRGYLPDDAAGNVTAADALALSSADVILSVGMRWNWTFRFGAEISKTCKLIQIDIDSHEIGRNIKPAVGITGDVKEVLNALLNEMGEVDWFSIPETVAWLNRLVLTRTARQHQLNTVVNKNNSIMNFQALFSVLSSVLPRDAITVLDGNLTLKAGKYLLPCYKPASHFTPGTNGCMGTGVPFALGAKIANPDKLVVAVCGDLAFGMAAMEMETIIRYKLPLIIIVTNNQGNHGSKIQNTFFGENYPQRVCMFMPDSHYEALSIAFGGLGFDVQTVEEFKTAMIEAITANRAACINVHIDPSDSLQYLESAEHSNQ